MIVMQILSGLVAALGLFLLFRYVRGGGQFIYLRKVGFFALALSIVLLLFDQGIIRPYHPTASAACQGCR